MTELFVFGLGYSALHFLRTRRRRWMGAAGTVRDAAKAVALTTEGIDTYVFNPATIDPAVQKRLATTSALLISAPPGANDPVLGRLSLSRDEAPALKSIVYLSTVGVYGDHNGAWIDESTPLRPTSARSRERVAAEAAWLALGEARGIPVHILRLGGIYGPGRSALEKVRDGTARRLIKPGQVFNRIHVEDISRAIEAAFSAQTGGVWNVTDDEPAPPQDVIAYAAELLGLPPPPDMAFETAELSPMARSFYGENKRVGNIRLKRELGVALAYPTYREGLKALL
jgi:nucleoside-diphosphate-sugar epimerase